MKENVLAALKEQLSEDLLSYWDAGKGRVYVEMRKERLLEVSKLLLEKFEARLVHINVIDLGIDGFKAVYSFGLDHLEKSLHINIVVRAPREDPRFPSLTPMTAQAEWAEREAMELLGVTFEGHPNPRRLFLPYEWPKPVESGWVPLKAKPTVPEAAVVPLGPYHPALIEGEYFRLRVDGEEIVDADLKMGFKHRGIMKLFEDRSYWRGVYLSERICGICSHAHTTAFTRTVEMVAGIEIPERALYIRSLIAELERIHSHLLWLGVAGDLVGFKSLFMWVWREREHVQDILELLTGNRCHYAMNTIGGVRRDISEEQAKKALSRLEDLRAGLKRVLDAVYDNPVLRARTEDVGVLKLPDAVDGGAVGPTARASGWRIDVRADDPYAAYEDLSWDVVVDEGKDVWARMVVRVKEALISADMCRQCLEALTKMKGEIRSEVSEFGEGEALGKTEAPRGELAYYVVSDGSIRPYAVRVRTPSYRNNALLPVMLRGYTLADAPIIIGSIDPCYACTDRVMIVDERTGRELQMPFHEFMAGRFKEGRG